MEISRTLPPKLLFSAPHSRVARFLVVGGISYVVNQALLYALYARMLPSLKMADVAFFGRVDWSLLLASLVALEISIIVRFALNDRWTFSDRRGRSLAVRFYQHNVYSFGSPLISLACVNVFTPYFGVGYLIANSIGILLGLAWNWLWSVRVIWARRPEDWAAERTTSLRRRADAA